MTHAVALRGVTKSYVGTSHAALADVTLAVEPGQFVALLGGSGSGKTTLLKTINGLIAPTAGEVLVEGRSASAEPPHLLRRRIGYAFQEVGLFPHLSVAENIGVTPRLLGWDAARIAARVDELLDLVELPQAFGVRLPAALSGGQRQRVGLARALAAGPRLLLLDEPFGALDPIVREALGAKLRELHEQLALTTIMVTHDPAEAVLLADRIVVLNAGEIVADGAAAQLLAPDAPETARRLLESPKRQAAALAAKLGAQA